MQIAAMRFFRFLLPLLVLVFIAAAKKPPLYIRFHTEVDSSSGSSFATQAHLPSGEGVTLSKAAQITEDDIKAIYPFPAPDGTMGCALKLDDHGRIALDTLSMEYKGGILLGLVNGRAVTAMVIDRRVTDGILYIRTGLTPAEIELMRKKYIVIGEEKIKKSTSTTRRGSIPDPTPVPAPPPLPPDPTSSPRGD